MSISKITLYLGKHAVLASKSSEIQGAPGIVYGRLERVPMSDQACKGRQRSQEEQGCDNGTRPCAAY